MAKITSVEFIGEHETYDLEIDHPDHQFYTSDGILTSNSHSVAYAIDSYYAAWLYTYHPHEWLASVLQTKTADPDKLSKSLAEVKMLGYKISQPDVNRSGIEWVYNAETEAFVPPLAAIKGVGLTAAREIIKHRPYKGLHDLLYDESGQWYHSKMNKTSFASLCKIEAFGSLQELRDGTIEHHKQLYEMLIENYNTLRKGDKGMTPTAVKRLQRKGELVPNILDVLREQTQFTEDWSRIEKITMSYDLTQTAPLHLIFPDGVLQKLERTGIPAVTELGAKKGVAWFFVVDCQQKKTKNGKPYLRVKVSDHSNETTWMRIWGMSKPLELYTLWMCEAKGDPDWGPSTGGNKIRHIPLEG